ncbi:MAG: HAMP domain-containing sensor histidine kinase [Trueperaceae bacterium]
MTRSLAGLPLRWRIAALAGVAIALLAVLASLTAFWVVRRSLLGDLQQSLRADVRKVAALYAAGGPGVAGASLAGPTGGVIVQLYDSQGSLLAASTEEFEQSGANLPAATVRIEAGVRDWSGQLLGRPARAAVAPFEFGSAVVIAETAFIARALGQLGRALLVTALVLVMFSALVAYLIAAAAIRPIRHLARQASRLGPERLEPIRYRGPRDEVGQLATSLNELIGRLKESLDSQRQFLAETSHELRTPLTSLQGYLDRATRKASPEVARELRDARRISHAMARLIRDLLQLSRGELVQELTLHLVDPVADVLAPIAEEFPGVRLEGRPATAMVLGDPERLRQLVRNLTANAVRAAGEPAAVTLALDVCHDGGDRGGRGGGRRERGGRGGEDFDHGGDLGARGGGAAEHGGDHVERSAGEIGLLVRDTGPGIAEDLRHRIFEKFYKGPGGGSGLGLAIVQQIAEAHGGRVDLESRPGFTEFRVLLPLADVPE